MKDFLRGYWLYFLGIAALWLGLYWQGRNEVVRVPQRLGGMRGALKVNSLYIFTQYRGQRLNPGDVVYVAFKRMSRTGGLTDTGWFGRVAAVEGERISMRNGRVYVNGRRRALPLVQPSDPRQLVEAQFQMEEVPVPRGCVFVLTDDRSDIVDSRIMGPIPLWAVTAFRRRR
ncbi:MAG: signal peptidase I [Planctomycetota bacterium]|nr:MAG: signal peptidase I [Planctomycetota bacterium]